MLVACRVADLSALEAHYADVNAQAQSDVEKQQERRRPVDVGRKTRVYLFRALSPKRRTMEGRLKSLIAGGVVALAAALAASSALAAPDYPPGLFENSPVVPSGPPNATAPSQPPDAADPFGPPPPDAVDQLDDYCDGAPFRTFHSLAKAPADGAGRLCTPLSKTDRHHVSGGDEPMRELRSLWGGF